MEPPPISKIASGSCVPGVVSAPSDAITASTPATWARTPSSAVSAPAICRIGSACVLTIAAIPTAFSMHVSPASEPEISTGASVSTASRSVIRMSPLSSEATRRIWLRMFWSIFPTFVVCCPSIFLISPAASSADIILSAPASMSIASSVSP